MFPVQSDELIFEDLSIFEQDNILDDLLADCAAPECNEVTDDKISVKKRRRRTLSGSQIQESKTEGSSDSKKTVHRDIERQRRQEMAGLYASLRSLLPLEYIKGKRAISDHMNQAVNYINDMEKKIGDMKLRREKLKRLSNHLRGAAVDELNPNSKTSDSPYSVKVYLLRDGMEILISSSCNEKSFPLSKVLADLLGQGLNVITCVSTRGNQCSIHKLQIELSDTTSIDLSELQERLVNLIKLA